MGTYITLFAESDGEEIWEESDHESDDDLINTDMPVSAPPKMPVFQTETKEYKSAHSLLRWIVGFLFVLQAKYHVPNTAVNLIIKFMFVLFGVLSRFSPFVAILRKLFPSSLHIMRKRFVQDLSFEKYPSVIQFTTLMTVALRLSVPGR